MEIKDACELLPIGRWSKKLRILVLRESTQTHEIVIEYIKFHDVLKWTNNITYETASLNT